MAGERSLIPDDIVLPADANGLSEIRHELRTYLNHIVGYGEMVLDEAESLQWAVGRRDMEDLLSSAGELTEQLANLLHALDSGNRTRCADVVNTSIQPALLRIKRITEHSVSDGRVSATSETVSDLERIGRSCQSFLEALGRGLQPRSGSKVDRTPTPPRAQQQLPGDGSASDSDNIALHSAHVLAVDDNEANLVLLKRFCERRGHVVTLAHTGEDALEILEDRRFDLMILDIMLPGINGFQVLEKIHDSSAIEVPVIVLSSLDDLESMVASLRLGAEDFLRKPFAGDILEARIQALLEKKRTASAGATVELNHSQESINPHGLSAREIQVLSHLAMGKSNREIGEALFITENTVTKHVSHIFTKADLGNRAEAGVYAVRHGLIHSQI